MQEVGQIIQWFQQVGVLTTIAAIGLWITAFVVRKVFAKTGKGTSWEFTFTAKSGEKDHTKTPNSDSNDDGEVLND